VVESVVHGNVDSIGARLGKLWVDILKLCDGVEGEAVDKSWVSSARGGMSGKVNIFPFRRDP
jgi:hypothetical protein